MAERSSKTAVLIAGPTASGKSALALDLARARHGVVINADAIQVYRDLAILSARPGVDEEALVPHRLYGHVAATAPYSVGHWLAEAQSSIAQAWDTGFVPIVVGGTGLYFRALERGLADIPPIPSDIRKKWRDFSGDLLGELATRDPEAAGRLGPADRQRQIRALEVIEATGRPLAFWQERGRAGAILSGAVVERRYVTLPRAELYARTEARFETMMARGALEEVRGLQGLAPDLPIMKAIGVPELSAHLRGEMSLAAAVAQAKQASRNYVKRQLTWWRGQGRDWFEGAPP
jgi:tRNA dimethylallyltransferase